MLGFKPHECFNLHDPTGWSIWSQRFQRYRFALGLDKEKGTVQVSTPIYSMGRTQRDFSVSFKLSDAQQNDFEHVVQECTRTSHQRKA